MAKDIIAQMEDIVVSLKPILSKRNKQKDIDAVEKCLQNIKRRETCILVCGEFKRGKSSFINAFLEQELCPVDDDIATAAVSIIKYGEKVKVTRQYGDVNNLKSEVLASLDAINQYVQGEAEEIDNTVLLEIEIPNPKLKSGIVLIDTPGVGGLDPRHAFLTNFFMPKADITVFVTYANEPMTVSEIDFLTKKVAPYSRHGVVLINKADLITTDKVQERIADVQKKCTNTKSKPKVIPVSSRLKLIYLKNKDSDTLKQSNFEQVEKEIDTLAETFGKGLLHELKNVILNLLDEIHKPLLTQIEQIREPDPKLIERLEAEMKTYDEQSKKLSDPNSEYRLNLNSIVTQAKNGVELRLQEESIILSANKLRELAESPKARENKKWLLEQVNNAIGSLAAELDMMIDDAFAQVMVMVGDHKELQSVSRFNYEINVNLTPAERSLGTIACDTARQTLPAIGIFAIAAKVAAVVFTGGAALPLVLAGGAALAFLGKNLNDAAIHNDANFFKNQLSPQISIAITHLRSYIQTRFTEFNQNLLSALQEGMQRVMDNKKNVVVSLTKLKAESVEKQKEKSILMADELKPIENLMKVTNCYLSNPFEKK